MRTDLKKASTELLACMMASDRQGAAILIDDLLLADVHEDDIVHKILNPALVRMGKLWGKEAISLSQAFVAGKTAEDVLARCLDVQSDSPSGTRGIVVMGNAEDDFHALGRRIVSAFARSSGWQIHDLGVDVTAEEYVDRAVQVGASVIGVSAMMLTTAQNIARVRDLLDERGLQDRIKLAAGGAVFTWRPELVAEVGADGTAASAAEADALFGKLSSEVEASTT